MSGIAWPADPVDTDSDGIPDSPTYDARDVREMHPWQGRSDSRPFGCLGGPVAGPNLANLVTLSGLNWTLNPHNGSIDAQASSLAGSYTYAFPLAQGGTIPDQNASHSRVDTIAIQLSDPAEGDGTSLVAVAPIYSQGIADGSNTVPAAPPRSVVYVRISVPQLGHGSPSIVWVAPSVVAVGGISPVPGGFRPGSPYRGQYLDDNGLWRFDGTTWQGIAGFDTGWQTLNLVGGGANPIVAGSPPAKVKVKNGDFKFQGLVAPDGGGTFPTGTTLSISAIGDLPAGLAGALPAFKVNVPVSSSGPAQDGRAIFNTDGSIVIITGGSAAPYFDLAGMSGAASTT